MSPSAPAPTAAVPPPEPPDATPARDAAATRTALLCAARCRFAAQGFAHTTTREIAGDAGVNVALVHRYFGSKDGLLEALLLEPQPVTLETDPSRPFEDVLVDSFVDGMQPGSWADFGGQHPLMLFVRDGGDTARVRELRERRVAETVDTVRAGVAGRTGIVDDVEFRIRTELVFGLVLGAVLQREQLTGTALAAADADALRAPLREAIVALLRLDPPGSPAGPDGVRA